MRMSRSWCVSVPEPLGNALFSQIPSAAARYFGAAASGLWQAVPASGRPSGPSVTLKELMRMVATKFMYDARVSTQWRLHARLHRS